MDDETQQLLSRFRAATSTSADDPTRRAIWAALQQDEAHARVVATPRRDVPMVWIATFALAAAIVLVWSIAQGLGDARTSAPAPSRDEALDRAATRDTGGATTTRNDAVVVPAVPEPASSPASEAPRAMPTAPAVVRPSPAAAPIAVENAGADDGEAALAREAALVARAREAALAGDRVRARAAIDEHARTFPHGALAPERWVLRIELACAAGELARARRDATAFFAEFPTSRSAITLRERPCDPVTKPGTAGQLQQGER